MPVLKSCRVGFIRLLRWRVLLPVTTALVLLAAVLTTTLLSRAGRGRRDTYENVQAYGYMTQPVNETRFKVASIALESKWRKDEVDELLAAFPEDLSIFDPTPRAEGEISERDQIRVFVQGMILQAVASRLRYGPAIDPEQRRRLESWLLSRLDSPDAGVRFGAVKDVIYAKLARRPDVRAKIDAMIESDPDPEVRYQALRQIEHDDYLADMERKGKHVDPFRR